MTEKIKIQGEEYPIKIGYYALKYAIQDAEKSGQTGITMENIFTEGKDVYESLLFYGLELGAKLEKQEFSFKREEAELLLDDCFQEFILLIPKFFPAEDSSEKKQTGPQKRPIKKK